MNEGSMVTMTRRPFKARSANGTMMFPALETREGNGSPGTCTQVYAVARGPHGRQVLPVGWIAPSRRSCWLRRSRRRLYARLPSEI